MKAKILKLHESNSNSGSVTIRQCSIYDDIKFLGHVFHGLEDIHEHIEMWGFASGNTMKNVPKKRCKVHVGAMRVGYPCFDADDYAYEDRSYWNYVFRDHPISEEDMARLSSLPYKSNHCRVHEDMPSDMLPIIYYIGEGDTMLVAT